MLNKHLHHGTLYAASERQHYVASQKNKWWSWFTWARPTDTLKKSSCVRTALLVWRSSTAWFYIPKAWENQARLYFCHKVCEVCLKLNSTSVIMSASNFSSNIEMQTKAREEIVIDTFYSEHQQFNKLSMQLNILFLQLNTLWSIHNVFYFSF